MVADVPELNLSQRASMSDDRQTVIPAESFNGAGKRPSLTPAHQVDLLTGTIGGISFSGSPMMFFIRRNEFWLGMRVSCDNTSLTHPHHP